MRTWLSTLCAGTALCLAVPVLAQPTQPTATTAPPAVTPAGKARQDKIDELVGLNPLASADGKKTWDTLFRTSVNIAIARQGRKSGLTEGWNPQHPLWQELQEATLAHIVGLTETMMAQSQQHWRTALVDFSDAELDAVLRINRSPLSRQVESGLLAALNLAALADSADRNDPQVAAYLKAEGEKQQVWIKTINDDPEIAAYMKSTAGKKVIAISMKTLGELWPWITARAEIAEAEMILRIAQYQGKAAAELLPLRNALLSAAAAAGNLTLVRQQLDLGAELRSRDARPGKRKETLLHHAAKLATIELLEFLLARDLRDLIDTADAAGYTPLHLAAGNNRPRHVTTLLAAGADVNVATTGLGTALHAASAQGHRPMVELLLARGAQVNATSSNGGTVLHQAALRGDLTMAQLLLSKGADVNAVEPTNGNTPLHHLGMTRAGADRLTLLGTLLDAGADLLRQNKHQVAAYTLVASSGEEAALLLLDRVPVDKRAALPEPPLLTATKAPYLKAMERLLAEGADPNATDRKGRSPLFVTAYWRQPNANQSAAMALLLKHGADPARRDADGLGLLDIAAMDGRAGFEAHADRLAGWGLRAAATGPDGRTALHRAITEPVVRKLLAMGAAVDAPDQTGNTPLHEAVLKNRQAVVKALLQAGADPERRNAAGDTPTILTEAIKPPAARDAMKKLLNERPASAPAR